MFFTAESPLQSWVISQWLRNADIVATGIHQRMATPTESCNIKPESPPIWYTDGIDNVPKISPVIGGNLELCHIPRPMVLSLGICFAK